MASDIVFGKLPPKRMPLGFLAFALALPMAALALVLSFASRSRGEFED